MPVNKPTAEELATMSAFQRAKAFLADPGLVDLYPDLAQRQVCPEPTRTNEFKKPARDVVSQLRAEPEDKKPNKSKSNEQVFRRLTRDHFHSQGYKYVRCDTWNAYAGVANDLMGAFDGLAFCARAGIVGVQLTSKANMAARRRKLKDNPLVSEWIASGGKVCLIGWHKPGHRWEPVVERLDV